MALDEYLFGRFARYIKKKKTESDNKNSTVFFADIKQRLTIIARALTSKAIDVYPAEREGGYKNNSFFFPSAVSLFQDYNQNLSFYFFRVLYLSIQKQKELNWHRTEDITNEEAQRLARENSQPVLEQMFSEFSNTEELYNEYINLLTPKLNQKEAIDMSWFYGKWMKDSVTKEDGKKLKNFNDKTKTANDHSPKTTLKAKPVEEVVNLTVDAKQQEDYVMTHNFEKVETAEEFTGSWRDFDGSDELEKHEEALSELNMKYTVRVDDTAHSLYQADFIENTNIAECEDTASTGACIQYPEWDYSKRMYKNNFCKLYPTTQLKSDSAYYKNTLARNASTLMGLRKMLTNVNNKWKQHRRQSQGDEFDIDALINLFVDVHTGHTPSENIYISNRKKEKDISILLLLDISLSSDSYVAGNRVLDIEKQTAILFGEILNEFKIDFSINCFYSKTHNYSTYLTLKEFDEGWNNAKLKIGAPEPLGYTRIGTALRHSGELLSTRDSKNKWVILLSDGKPNDFDKYEGRYGIEDVKQAIRELGEKQINSYALAIEASAKYYLPQMFGQNHYQILSSPVELLTSLAKLYEKIKN
ncbi:MAG: VWA domain-containing protein [Bacteroidia bacterium]